MKNETKSPESWRKSYQSGPVKRLILPSGGLVIDGINIHHTGPAAGHSTLALSRPEDYNGDSPFSPVLYAIVPSEKKFSVGKTLDRLPDNAVPTDLFFPEEIPAAEILKTMTKKNSLSKKGVNKLGFNQVLWLGKKDKYTGNADLVMIVWNKYQVVPANEYRKAHYEGKIVDIAICEDRNIQEQLGEKAAVYHYSGGCH